MWKFFFVLVVFLLLSIGAGMLAREKVERDLSKPVPYPTQKISPSPTNSPINATEKNSLFVPYWQVTNQALPEQFTSYNYFGITSGSTGIDTTEQGARVLSTFLQSVPSEKEKLLTLRMINSESNFSILKDTAKQNSLIGETIAIAKEHHFNGIILDLEVSAVPFESLINQITSFTTRFAKATKQEKLRFTVLMYGDVFYRIRPFEVKALAKQSDEVMIMAYDFSKARGNPGPNFPLRGKEVYGYDMTEMAKDFLEAVPSEKLTVVFGLYGYDWEVDEKGVALSQGEAVTDEEIKQKFLGTCPFVECSIRRKNDSSETEIRYIDQEGKRHSIWFEDLESVTKKKQFLKQKGITSFSFWAYGYF